MSNLWSDLLGVGAGMASNKLEEVLTEDHVREAADTAAALAGDDELAKAGIQGIRDNAGSLAGLTRGAAASALGHFTAGQETEAEKALATGNLTFEQRRALMQAGTDRTLAAGDAIKARRDALKTIGTAALTKALPLLLAAL